MRAHIVATIGPTVSLETLELPADQRLYGKLYLHGDPGDVRVRVDHDPTQEVGWVSELLRWPVLWNGEIVEMHAVRAVVEEVPSWLKKGTGTSIGGVTLARETILGRGVTGAALVREISLVSPAQEPACPAAKVQTIFEERDPLFDPPPLPCDLPPLTAETAELHYRAHVAIGLDPELTLRDISRKLSPYSDPRLGRTRIVSRRGQPVAEQTLRRDCRTILRVS